MIAASPSTAEQFRKRAQFQSQAAASTAKVLEKATLPKGEKKAKYAVCVCGKLEKDCNDPSCTVKRTLKRVDDRKLAQDAHSAEVKAVARLRKENKIRAKEGLPLLSEEDMDAQIDIEQKEKHEKEFEDGSEDLHLITEDEIERRSQMEILLSNASKIDREIEGSKWTCQICRQSGIAGQIAICPACHRPKGAMLINRATNMDGVLETEGERRRARRNVSGQKIPKSVVGDRRGKLSSLSTAGMSRAQRRIARVQARHASTKPKKRRDKNKNKNKNNSNSKRGSNIESDQEKIKELSLAEKLIENRKQRARIYKEESAAAGLNPIKRVRAGLRAFARRRIDGNGIFSKSLAQLLGDDYVHDLKGIERRPTYHYLPGLRTQSQLTLGSDNSPDTITYLSSQ